MEVNCLVFELLVLSSYSSLCQNFLYRISYVSRLPTFGISHRPLRRQPPASKLVDSLLQRVSSSTLTSSFVVLEEILRFEISCLPVFKLLDFNWQNLKLADFKVVKMRIRCQFSKVSDADSRTLTSWLVDYVIASASLTLKFEEVKSMFESQKSQFGDFNC